jgi:Zn-dependent protease with chaperone function
MSRDLVLAGLVLIVCGSLAWLSGLLPGRAADATRERAAWRRLWAPLAPAATMLAVLVGWAFQEPARTDELLLPTALALAVPLGLVWMRALARAIFALRVRADAPAAVVGLARPRVEIDPTFARALDAAALGAVLAHEEAHARHRDPLRIWLAQIATDLQWPLGAAPARLAAWLEALELARDDEARRAGVRGEDLASALVSAARFATGARRGVAATLGAPASLLAARVSRLLRPLEGDAAPARARAWLAGAALALAIAAGALAGWTHGDLMLRALPFVTS